MAVRNTAGGNEIPVDNPAVILVDKDGVPVFGPTSVVQNPVSAYQISDIDNTSNPSYYGFLKPSGAWYIQRVDSTTARYASGASGYTTAWSGRTGLTYNYINNITLS